MFKWIQKIDNKWKLILIVCFTLLFVLSLSLLISAIVHDGVNEFAKAFIIYEKKEIKDERWKEFLKYAQENNLAVEHINKLRDIFGDSYFIDIEKQNTIGFASFILSMVLLMFIAFSFISSLIFSTISEVRVHLNAIYNVGMVEKEQYDIIWEQLDIAERKYAQRKNKNFNINELKQKLEEVEKEKEV